MGKRRQTHRPDRGAAETMTDGEWAVMDVLWQQHPSAAGTVQEALQETRGWAYSTVKTTMDRMVAKGLLATSSIRNLTLYRPLLSRQEARRGELRRCLQRAFDGALTPMIQFLADEANLSEAELKELRQLIKRSKRVT